MRQLDRGGREQLWQRGVVKAEPLLRMVLCAIASRALFCVCKDDNICMLYLSSAGVRDWPAVPLACGMQLEQADNTDVRAQLWLNSCVAVRARRQGAPSALVMSL